MSYLPLRIRPKPGVWELMIPPRCPTCLTCWVQVAPCPGTWEPGKGTGSHFLACDDPIPRCPQVSLGVPRYGVAWRCHAGWTREVSGRRGGSQKKGHWRSRDRKGPFSQRRNQEQETSRKQPVRGTMAGALHSLLPASQPRSSRGSWDQSPPLSLNSTTKTRPDLGLQSPKASRGNKDDTDEDDDDGEEGGDSGDGV